MGLGPLDNEPLPPENQNINVLRQKLNVLRVDIESKWALDPKT